MGIFDRLFGRGDAPHAGAAPRPQNPAGEAPQASAYRDGDGRYAPPPPIGAPGTTAVEVGSAEDERAIERYRYLLRTAPPETIEQVHAEAFGRLTDAQRQQVLADLPAAERPASSDPQTMARAATRAEYGQPGFMERTFGGRSFGGGQGAPGFGSMVGASILGTIGGYVVGSALVGAFMGPAFAADQDGDPADAGAEADSADTTVDAGAGDAGWDAGGGDLGGFGDFGGDVGGFDGF